MKFDTLLIHGGINGDDATGSVNVPIHQTSTYAQTDIGEHKGYEYSRTGNPTRAALEKLIADLEQGQAGFAFASGMAAIATVLMLFKSGDHLIVGEDVYGGTFRVVDKVFKNFGIEADFVDTSSADVERHIKPNTKAILIETPSNPLMKVTDIKQVAAVAADHQLLLIVDNTFMTPYLQKPLQLGADIVLHSATKYLGGHSDLVAGLVVVKEAALAERLYFLQNSTGAVLGPFDSWLLIKGIKTLAVRMDRHCDNAQKIVHWLEKQAWVNKIYYPNVNLPQGQMTNYGGMISFEVKDVATVQRLLSKLKTITLAESLGGVESLISVPARMTHASIPVEQRQKAGISEQLVRLSVGIEAVEDIIQDLEFSLK